MAGPARSTAACSPGFVRPISVPTRTAQSEIVLLFGRSGVRLEVRPHPLLRTSSMRLLGDLWITSPRRSAMVAMLILLAASGQAAASALAGPVLLHHSTVLFIVLVVALVAVVVGDLLMNLVMAGLSADWS